MTNVDCKRTDKYVTFYRTMSRHYVDVDMERVWRDFGVWIEARREKEGLSQDGAARLAGIRRQQWIKIAKGASTKRQTVIRMAEAVKADPVEALERAGFKAFNNSREIVASTQAGQRAAEYVDNLPPERQTDALAILATLSSIHGITIVEAEKSGQKRTFKKITEAEAKARGIPIIEGTPQSGDVRERKAK